MNDTTITDVLNAVRFAATGAGVHRFENIYEAACLLRAELNLFERDATSLGWGSDESRRPDPRCVVHLIQLGAACARALLDLDIGDIVQPCPCVEGCVTTGWCGARGHKISAAQCEYRCPDQWNPEVRADCCRVYFEEREKKEASKECPPSSSS